MKAETKKIRIVILGAGFAGVNTFRYLHKKFHSNKQIEIIIVNPKNYFLFTPLLHEVATGGLPPDTIMQPIRSFITCCQTDFYQATAQKIHSQEQLIQTSLGNISYDYLVIALGAKTNFFNITNARKHCFTLKTMEDAIKLKNHVIECFEHARHEADAKKQKQLLQFAVIGGGPTGVEIASELAEFIHKTFRRFYPLELMQHAQVHLIERSDKLVSSFAPTIQRESLKQLQKAGVNMHLQQSVESIDENGITLESGKTLHTATPIFVAGIKAAEIEFDIKPAKSFDGKITVNASLQITSSPEIFVLGDMADHPENVPALAQAAVQQASATAINIQRLINNKPVKAFHYKSAGMLLSLGRWKAAAQIGSFSLTGRVAWWMWRTIYFAKLISWKQRLRATVEWTIRIFTHRDISEL